MATSSSSRRASWSARNAAAASKAATGSGKTFSYLAPLASATLRAVASHEVRASSLVLCPNAALCSQVVRAARSLETKEGLPVVSVQQVSGGRGGGDGGLWTEIRPRSLPDLFVATPAGLLNALYAESSSPRLREQVLGGIARVVFDEADMLLDGGYRRQTEQLLAHARAHLVCRPKVRARLH